MKINYSFFLILAVILLTLDGCNKDVKALDVQSLYSYSPQYYENLRAYKQSNHQIFYGYYAAYAPIQGATGNITPASWGDRIMGIPDSVDVVNLWMGIPTASWQPLALADMQYCQQVKGTRFVVHADAATSTSFVYNGDTIALSSDTTVINKYGQYLVDEVLNSNIDGVDLDYEPQTTFWTTSANMVALIKYIAQYFGPTGKYPNKLLIIDFYSTTPPAATGSLVSYFVRQAYAAGSDATLQSGYASVASFIPPSKYIICEDFGSYAATGGVAFTEANGNNLTSNGTQMYSLEGFARWTPTQGTKGGFGAYYFDKDYYSVPGIPYYNVRRCIQIANPQIQ